MDLKSSDVQVQQKAMEKADCYIAALEEPYRTKVNKTTMNTNPSPQTSLVKTLIQSHNQDLLVLSTTFHFARQKVYITL